MHITRVKLDAKLNFEAFCYYFWALLSCVLTWEKTTTFVHFLKLHENTRTETKEPALPCSVHYLPSFSINISCWTATSHNHKTDVISPFVLACKQPSSVNIVEFVVRSTDQLGWVDVLLLQLIVCRKKDKNHNELFEKFLDDTVEWCS